MARRSRSRRWTLPIPTRSPGAAVNPASTVRVLGLDPGSILTGYAVIECVDGHARYLTSGSIRTAGDSFPERLSQIFRCTAEVTRQWQPQEIAVERVFLHRNADSALKLGQARGAALCGVFSVAAPVFEYSAREVKQAVVGTGAAQKEQVQLMVKHLLQLSGDLKADSADAVAIALCHANTRRMQLLTQPFRQSGAAR